MDLFLYLPGAVSSAWLMVMAEWALSFSLSLSPSKLFTTHSLLTALFLPLHHLTHTHKQTVSLLFALSVMPSHAHTHTLFFLSLFFTLFSNASSLPHKHFSYSFSYSLCLLCCYLISHTDTSNFSLYIFCSFFSISSSSLTQTNTHSPYLCSFHLSLSFISRTRTQTHVSLLLALLSAPTLLPVLQLLVSSHVGDNVGKARRLLLGTPLGPRAAWGAARGGTDRGCVIIKVEA